MTVESRARPMLDAARLTAESFLAGVEQHAVLGSTNDRARELAAEPATPLPTLIVADVQTAGRGRGGNRWWTGPGSLAFSLLLDSVALGIERRVSPQLSLTAALAVIETVQPLVEPQPVGLHWPNDVFVGGRKLAGVLVEGLSDGRHILGVGLNTNNTVADAPPELRETATTLLDLTGRSCDHTEILLTFLEHLQDVLGALAVGSPVVGKRYDALCLQRGRMLTIQAAGSSMTGRCAGIAGDGALLLETASGVQKFHGGAVIKSTTE